MDFNNYNLSKILIKILKYKLKYESLEETRDILSALRNNNLDVFAKY